MVLILLGSWPSASVFLPVGADVGTQDAASAWGQLLGQTREGAGPPRLVPLRRAHRFPGVHARFLRCEDGAASWVKIYARLFI